AAIVDRLADIGTADAAAIPEDVAGLDEDPARLDAPADHGHVREDVEECARLIGKSAAVDGAVLREEVNERMFSGKPIKPSPQGGAADFRAKPDRRNGCAVAAVAAF